jgi:asparagine synthase (glutamine-hydrolysing)
VLAHGLGIGAPPDQPGIRTHKLGDAKFLFQSGAVAHVTPDGSGIVMEGYVYGRDDFPSASNDAELIYRLHQQRGFAGALESISGDFAVALYDSREGKLYLGRDRLGVRPLYWAKSAEGVAFASRPLALASLPGVGKELNRLFVARFASCHYRYFDQVPTESPYRNVSQLPAANWLCWDSKEIRTGNYWQLLDQPDWQTSEEELAFEYRELFLDAVRRRIRVVKNPAFTLSGGMDSSSVLAAAAHTGGRKFPAFSSVYQDRTYDESRDIEPMHAGPVSTWNPVAVDNPDIYALIRRMIAAHDEPVATATWLSHFQVAEAMGKAGHDAVFGGLGGDELNAGEYEYFFFHFADLEQARQKEVLQHEIAEWARHHDHPIWRKNARVAQETLGRIRDRQTPGRCLPDPERWRRYAPILNPDYADLRSFQPILEHRFSSYLKNRTWQDLSRETAPCCLRAEDRQTAVFGLRNIDPFFDHRLVEFMFRVPGTMKIRHGVTKVLLRKAMQGILPEETRLRVKKTGWNAPAHLWFSGKNLDLLRDLVRSPAVRNTGIYLESEVDRLISEHENILEDRQPRENHMMFLWQLANVCIWLEEIA